MFRQLAGVIVIAIWLVPAVRAQTINLNAIIGGPGTNAATIDGIGNAVNTTGVGSNSGFTVLTAGGSTNPSAFDFNTGLAGGDRAIGSGASAGDVFADRKHDNGVSGLFILDTNNDGSFLDETQSNFSGFGLHSDTFITFDLDVIRTSFALAPGTPFTLSGLAGQANYTVYTNTSAAIILDSSPLAVFDWNASHQSDPYSLMIAGSAHYLTFVALSGLDLDNWGAHVGFANVQLAAAVPEPSAYAALAGLAALGLATLRRRKT